MLLEWKAMQVLTLCGNGDGISIGLFDKVQAPGQRILRRGCERKPRLSDKPQNNHVVRPLQRAC